MESVEFYQSIGSLVNKLILISVYIPTTKKDRLHILEEILMALKKKRP